MNNGTSFCGPTGLQSYCTVSYCTVILPHVALAHDSRSVCPCDREASHWAPLPLTSRRMAVRDRPGEKTTHPAVWLISAWLWVWRGILIISYPFGSPFGAEQYCNLSLWHRADRLGKDTRRRAPRITVVGAKQVGEKNYSLSIARFQVSTPFARREVVMDPRLQTPHPIQGHRSDVAVHHTGTRRPRSSGSMSSSSTSIISQHIPRQSNMEIPARR